MHETLLAAPPPSAAWDLRPFELLQDGWRLVASHYAVLMGVLLGAGALLGLFSRVPYVGGVGVFVVFSAANSGITWFLLRVSRGEKVSWKVFLEPFRQRAFAVLTLHALAAGLIVLGLVCGVVPGLYLAVAFELSLALLLAQDLTPWQALTRSRHYVHRQLGDFIMLSLTLVVINGIAALLFALPLLWTLPATCGAATLVAAQVLGWRQRSA